MNKSVSIVLGLALLLGGAALAYSNIAPLQAARELNDLSKTIGRTGEVTELKNLGTKTEMTYWYEVVPDRFEPTLLVRSENFASYKVATKFPLVVARSDHSLSRPQAAESPVYSLMRNIVIGGFLGVLGLALMFRSNPATATTGGADESHAGANPQGEPRTGTDN